MLLIMENIPMHEQQSATTSTTTRTETTTSADVGNSRRADNTAASISTISSNRHHFPHHYILLWIAVFTTIAVIGLTNSYIGSYFSAGSIVTRSSSSSNVVTNSVGTAGGGIMNFNTIINGGHQSIQPVIAGTQIKANVIRVSSSDIVNGVQYNPPPPRPPPQPYEPMEAQTLPSPPPPSTTAASSIFEYSNLHEIIRRILTTPNDTLTTNTTTTTVVSIKAKEDPSNMMYDSSRQAKQYTQDVSATSSSTGRFEGRGGSDNTNDATELANENRNNNNDGNEKTNINKRLSSSSAEVAAAKVNMSQSISTSTIATTTDKSFFNVAPHVFSRMSSQKQHFCGKTLKNTLRLLCHGQYYYVNNRPQLLNKANHTNPSLVGKAKTAKLNDLTDIYDANELLEIQQKQQLLKNGNLSEAQRQRIEYELEDRRLHRLTRGIVDECCRKPCSFHDLRQYCLNK